MDGFEQRKRKKTEQIFEAARQLMQKYGYSKVSVNEIAEAAKVSPATIFNYFGTKERLFAEMLDDWTDKQITQYEDILASDRPFEEKLKAIMMAESGNLKFMYGAKSVPEAVVHAWMGNRGTDKIMRFYMKLIALGKAENSIWQAYSDETLQRYFHMYLNEFHQGADPSRMDQLLRLFFFGLSGPTNRST
ncbi:TetR family transcriptional regulator [Cohnella sp. CFH 77786]|uniref:TetR/AcrR family transcriptional regulator n=1 Tax=Cohnella sp. CFH 77786 TaxID=2662265 RepID=UPI001C608D33|nr:TetR/AcrR family transcriptional regulator [Cohnella sp. CFH 77786]MBW5446391.1 TetR family transcriptional regulator [Cohnella sp. CFH 77786]